MKWLFQQLLISRTKILVGILLTAQGICPYMVQIFDELDFL